VRGNPLFCFCFPISAALPLSLLTVPGLLDVGMPDVPVAAVPVSAVWCLSVPIAPLACEAATSVQDDGSRMVSGRPIRLPAVCLGAAHRWMPVDKHSIGEVC